MGANHLEGQEVTDDPFATASEIEPAVREKVFGQVENGRYWLPDPADPLAWEPGAIGAKPFPRGFMRTSNLVGAYSELRALMIWSQHRVLEGMIERPDLYADLSVLPRDEEGKIPYRDGQRITEAALSAAKADRWSVIGTAYHKALEIRLTTGALVGTREIRDGILALEAHMRACLLRPAPALTERVVVNTKVMCAGRFDVPVYDLAGETPVLKMADLKTKRKQFWSVLEVRAQLAVYANADAMWDDALGCYVQPPAFDPTEGIILHLPQGGGPLELLRMDLVAGWRTALRAREVVDDRASAKSAPYLRSLTISPAVLDTVHAACARLALVESLTEGSEVWHQIPERIQGYSTVREAMMTAIRRLSGDQLTTALTSA